MSDEITVFAETTYRNQSRKFGIKTDDRRRHMYLIGKTGMGKSTIQENMIIEDIRAGRGVAVVDPHGDLAEKVIKFIPEHRINDVIYFNPADQEYPIAFNIVEHVDPSVRHLVASGLIGVFQKLWAESWGPRLEYILRNAILAVLDYPDSTLLSVVRMLSDKKFRKKIVDNIQNPVIKAFWVTEFSGYNDKFASEAVAPIQNKVGQFLSTTLIRNIVGQTTSSIDMRKIMDEEKILILNLSKGRIGEDNSALLGSMIITKIQLAAMSRVNIPEEERKDFFLYVDEFQNFATDSFANILSEARKYRLSLVLAHQYIEQLPETVRNAVFGNVGTLITFRVGAVDAEALAPEFFPTFLAEDIVNLPKYEVYLKLMIDGIASEPFSARGLPPLINIGESDNVEKIIQVSREKYAESRKEVEEKIIKWHEDNDNDNNYNNNAKKSIIFNSTVKNKEGNKPNNIYKYSANCAKCGKETKLSFEPDGIRPIYCTNCLSTIKKEKKDEFTVRQNVKKEEIKNINQQVVNNSNIKNKKNIINNNYSQNKKIVQPFAGKFNSIVIKEAQTTEKKILEKNTQNQSEKKDIKQTDNILFNAKKNDTEISLNDVFKKKAVNFSDNKKVIQEKNKIQEQQNNNLKNKTTQNTSEHEIDEDEEINF